MVDTQNIRIVEIPAMTVASIQCISTSPEKDSLKAIAQFVEQTKLYQLKTDRRVGKRRLAAISGRFPTPSLRTGLTPLEVSGSPFVIDVLISVCVFFHGTCYRLQVFYAAFSSWWLPNRNCLTH